jgi:cytidylate kinase
MTYIEFFREKFDTLKKENPEHKPIICIDGMSGTGKDTVALILKEELKKVGIEVEIKNAGDFFREVAKERGYENLDEFSEARRNDSELAKKVDIRIDEMTLEYGFKHGGIITSRLSIGVLGDEADVRIFILAHIDKIAERVANDSSREEFGKPVEEIKQRILNRNKADMETYEKLYNIKYNEVETRNSLILRNDGTKEDLRKKMKGVANLVEGLL